MLYLYSNKASLKITHSNNNMQQAGACAVGQLWLFAFWQVSFRCRAEVWSGESV